MTDIVLIPDSNRTLTVLRNEAEAARNGTMVVDGPDIEMAELLDDAADEIERLRHQCEGLAKSALSNGEDLLRHEAEIERLRTANERLRKALGDLIGLAEAAMRDANRDGSEYDINAELTDAREALDRARELLPQTGDEG